MRGLPVNEKFPLGGAILTGVNKRKAEFRIMLLDELILLRGDISTADSAQPMLSRIRHNVVSQMLLNPA